MLKGISKLLSPDLLKVLMEMGHGDEITIGDGNFPAAQIAGKSPLLRCDGHSVPEILGAIMPLLPLDQYAEHTAILMEVTAQDQGRIQPSRWAEYRAAIRKHEPDFSNFQMLERFAFYERARQSYAVIASGDSEIYANIILKKGIIKSL